MPLQDLPSQVLRDFPETNEIRESLAHRMREVKLLRQMLRLAERRDTDLSRKAQDRGVCDSCDGTDVPKEEAHVL